MASCNEAGTESEKSKQCPCKCGKGIAVFFVLFLLAGIACWYIHHPNRPSVYPAIEPKPGAMCTVYLMTGESVTGTVIIANRVAILLEREVHLNKVQIPRSSILYSEYRQPELP